jgi:hypothetical protein
MSIIRMLANLLIAVVALWFASTGLLAAPQEESGVSVYSDICAHAESGDLLGARVVVMRFKEGDYVLFQMAEGVIEAPRLGKAIMDSKSGEIVFRIPESEKLIATFKGKITEQSLIGSFDNNWVNGAGAKTFRLPKIAGRQRSFPECR